jgi:hypothetical protein
MMFGVVGGTTVGVKECYLVSCASLGWRLVQSLYAVTGFG